MFKFSLLFYVYSNIVAEKAVLYLKKRKNMKAHKTVPRFVRLSSWRA